MRIPSHSTINISNKRAFVQQEIGYNKIRLIKFLLIAELCGFISLLCIRSSFIWLKLFWIPLLISIRFAIIFILRLLTPPVVLINSDGFIDCRTGYGLIDADDIVSVGRTTAFNKRRLFIVVKDYSKYLGRLKPDELEKANKFMTTG